MDQDKILREPEVLNIIGCSSPTLRRMEKKGQFPVRRKISQRGVGWLKSEVSNWCNDRPNVDQAKDSTEELESQREAK